MYICPLFKWQIEAKSYENITTWLNGCGETSIQLPAERFNAQRSIPQAPLPKTAKEYAVQVKKLIHNVGKPFLIEDALEKMSVFGSTPSILLNDVNIICENFEASKLKIVSELGSIPLLSKCEDPQMIKMSRPFITKFNSYDFSLGMLGEYLTGVREFRPFH